MSATAHTPSAAPRCPEPRTEIMRAGAPTADAFTLLDHRSRQRTVMAADAPGGRYLALESGDGDRLIALERPITHIGRGLIANVRLDDPQVSRRHAIVTVRGDTVRILDDRSANGTFVNGRRVDAARLVSGDVIRVGRAVLRYVEVTEPARRRGAEPVRRIPVGALRRRARAGQPAVLRRRPS